MLNAQAHDDRLSFLIDPHPMPTAFRTLLKYLLLAVVLAFMVNLIAVAFTWSGTDTIEAFRFRRLSFFINGNVCGVDLMASSGRLLVAGFFLALALWGYQRGDLRSPKEDVPRP